MVKQKYDISMKLLAQNYPRDYAKLVLGKEFSGIVEFKSETLPEVSKRETDILLKIIDPNTEEDFILHIEFQSKHESDIPDRMLEYYARIVRHYKIKNVYSVVIYLNPKYAPKNIPASYEHKFRNKTTLYEYEVIKIWEIESNQIIDNKLYGLYPLLSLTKDSDLKECYNKIESIDIDNKLKKELYTCAYVLAGIKYTEELIESLTKEEIMLESVTYQKIIEKGKKEERLERLNKDVVSVLRARFNRVPRRITTKIKNIKQYTKLEQLLKIAAISKDLDEFEKNL